MVHEIFEDIKIYLPKYLSEESTAALFKDLSGFTQHLKTRKFYTNKLDEKIVFQGDGIKILPLVNLPDSALYEAAALVLSNTCDYDQREQGIDPCLIYAPIIKISDYINMLEKNGYSSSNIEEYIKKIKEQRITQYFFLPSGEFSKEESIVLLNRVSSCDSSYIDESSIKDIRWFSLDNFGWYIFLLKLSIHFTRVREKVDRS